MSEAGFVWVGGEVLREWHGGWVEWRLDAVCGAWGLRARAAATELPGALRAGAACAVRLRDGGAEREVLRGRVDAVAHRLDGRQALTEVRGRSGSADLVDCSAPPSAWQQQPALTIARALCAPHGVAIRDEAGLAEPFARFATAPGERVAAALTRLARARGALVGDAPAGGLRFSARGRGAAGGCCAWASRWWAAQASENAAARFRLVRALGEAPEGTPALGEAADPGAPAARRLDVLAEEPLSAAGLASSAGWARGLRLAEAARAALELPGWDAIEDISPVGGIVQVEAAAVGLAGEALVERLAISLDAAEGPRLRVGVVHPAAWQAQADPALLATPWLA